MKRALLFIVVPALLVALGFAQTPTTTINTDQATIKGCLGGSDGNYTVVEDNTGHIFKITTSSVNLKPHLNHDVTLVGHKASGASPTPADNSLAVTEVKMISEHCAAAAAAATAPVTIPSEIASTPVVAATAPATTTSTPAADATKPAETASTPAADTTTAPAATASTPAADATAPAATTSTADATPPVAIVAPSAETPSAPAADATAPVATVSTQSETASTPAAHHRRRSETPAVAAAPAVAASSPPDTPKTPAATAVTPVATDSASSAPVSTPAAVAPKPTPASNGWSLWLLIAFGVLVVVVGIMFPFVNRWRKQRNLERTDAPNLSFNREDSSDQNPSGQGKDERKGPRKAA
jgi:hypothetical protein